jgi:ArsR family transcriptional regulator, zinc-responsive transcriptional repressor
LVVVDKRTPELVDAAVDLLKALASPVRLAAVDELCKGPRCVHELQAALKNAGREVSQPLLSQHLKVLRDAGLVTTTRRGTEITYQLADAHVGHIVNDTIRHAQEEHP